MLVIKDIVKDTYTNASGYTLYTVMKDSFKANQIIELSFEGITSTSSSFLNSSFGSLIDEFGLNHFMRLVKPKNLSKAEAEIVKRYVSSFKDSSTSIN